MRRYAAMHFQDGYEGLRVREGESVMEALEREVKEFWSHNPEAIGKDVEVCFDEAGVLQWAMAA